MPSIYSFDRSYNFYFALLAATLAGTAIGFVLSYVLRPSRRKGIRSIYGKSNNSETLISSETLNDIKGRRNVLLELERAFRVSKVDLEAITVAFLKEVRLGLVRSYTDDMFVDNKTKNSSEKDDFEKSTLPMLPSYVDRLPTGEEEGTYLAVDFGGTHVRMIKVKLEPGDSSRPRTPVQLSRQVASSHPPYISMIQKKLIIPDDLKHGSGYDLFDYIAQGVADFMSEHADSDYENEDPILLGFTFSFGVQQHSINSGIILGWNKDFKCDDVIGKDPVELLQSCLAKKGLSRIRVAALVNDTIGTLVTHAYKEAPRSTQIAVILGTGSNAAYNEQISKIKKFSMEAYTKQTGRTSSNMLINTEFGAFNPDLSLSKEQEKGVLNGSVKPILPRTKYDIEIDEGTRNPNHQVYEKLISGYYLGEIVRIVLIDLIKQRKLFKNVQQYDNWSINPEIFGILGRRRSFDASYMSRIERDHSSTLADTRSLLRDIFKIEHDLELCDLQVVKFVCELVAIRSARLSAAVIAGLIHHMGLAQLLVCLTAPEEGNGTWPHGISAGETPLKRPPSKLQADDTIAVAIDGSLFEHYPHYANRMMDALRELFGSKAQSIDLALSKDGSGLGAALIAALTKK